jgi:hypothetical protein
MLMTALCPEPVNTFCDLVLLTRRLRAFCVQELRMRSHDQGIDHKTHILLGVRASGGMAVIANWPYVPPHAEVQEQIARTREPCVTFALCTPTSLIAAEPDALRANPAPSGLEQWHLFGGDEPEARRLTAFVWRNR